MYDLDVPTINSLWVDSLAIIVHNVVKFTILQQTKLIFLLLRHRRDRPVSSTCDITEIISWSIQTGPMSGLLILSPRSSGNLIFHANEHIQIKISYTLHETLL